MKTLPFVLIVFLLCISCRKNSEINNTITECLSKEYKDVYCPKCNKKAKFEVILMPTVRRLDWLVKCKACRSKVFLPKETTFELLHPQDFVFGWWAK